MQNVDKISEMYQIYVNECKQIALRGSVCVLLFQRSMDLNDNESKHVLYASVATASL